ncbi:TPA: hypothetical protein PNO53_001331 [Salmonella enterica]|nr:hypothetical protein [Salmonella enterica]
MMLALRNLLRNLKSNLLDNATFREELEKVKSKNSGFTKR